jgi:hypothetical protein
MVLAQDAYPGAGVYHSGWYNALNIAIFVLAAAQVRALRKRDAALFSGLAAATFGAAIVVFAGVASGLMGPDTHTIVGAPGASVHDDDVSGDFVFPLSGGAVMVQRGRSMLAIGSGRRYAGGFIFWQQPRTVLAIDAADARGNHLTITQPTNASFLSPVLLMQQRTIIDGMNVQFDSFSVPALRRNVKAVLFNEQQAAQLHTDPPIVGQPAILFAVSNSAEQVVPHGIGITAPGVSKTIGDLRLTGNVQQYPAIVVASAPYLPVLILGLLLVAAGAALSARQQKAHNT